MPRGPKVVTKEYHVPSSGSWRHDGFTLRKVTTGSGRNEKVEWHKRVSKDLYLDGDVEYVINAIREAAEGVLDARVDSDYYYDYGDSERSHRTMVVGWSVTVTEEEIAKATEHEREEERRRVERERAHAERALADIRARFPEMLNEG